MLFNSSLFLTRSLGTFYWALFRLMPITLDRLPFDILFHVSSILDFDDIIHLGYTCRQLKALLHENTLCRKAIEVRALLIKTIISLTNLAPQVSCSTQQRSKAGTRAKDHLQRGSQKHLRQTNSLLQRKPVLCSSCWSRNRIHVPSRRSVRSKR
jgi:hypothetical protein